MSAERGIEGKELPNETARFSPEARRLLEKTDLPIFTLTGKSIRELRQSGVQIEPQWPDQEHLETLPSRKSQVSIETPYLRHCNYKSLAELKERVEEYSKGLSKRIPCVEAIIGEAPDYVELNALWIEKYGASLFDYDFHLVPKFLREQLAFFNRFSLRQSTRTRTVTLLHRQSLPASTAAVWWEDGIHHIRGLPIEQLVNMFTVTPLIVPKNLT